MKQIKKPLFLVIITVLLSSFTVHQDDTKKGIARVNKMHGVEVYFMSEPLRAYKVIVESGGLIDNFNVNTVTRKPTTADKAGQLVKATIKKATKEGFEIDAVLYSNGKSAVGIQFTDEATEQNKGMARVEKIKGLDVFLFAEPVVEYEIITGDAKSRAASSLGGIMSSSIEEDADKLVGKAQKAANRRVGDLNAVLYRSGKTGLGISYKTK